MRARSGRPGPFRKSPPGFTLIELLVVVAIIALLISILLPSLSKARAQARMTLCATRISQLGRAMLLYTEAYREYPPFLGCTPGRGFPDPSENIGGIADPNEDWIVRLPAGWSKTECLNGFFRCEERDWPSEIRVPHGGTLYEYARFETLYRCPDFERVRHPEKTQSVVNYTRPEWGRRFRCPGPPGEPAWPGFSAEGGYVDESLGFAVGDFKGRILRVSEVFSPGSLPILLDEQWDRHVARPPAMFGDDTPYHWLDTDPLMSMEDEVGRYHGSPVVESRYYDPEAPIKRGSVCYYDGHADFRRDPAPSELPDTRDVYANPVANARKLYGSFKFLFEAIFAQRGLTPPVAIPTPPWL